MANKDELALCPQSVNLLTGLNTEALDQERGVQPGSVEGADEHADLKVGCHNFECIQHGYADPPTGYASHGVYVIGLKQGGAWIIW